MHIRHIIKTSLVSTAVLLYASIYCYYCCTKQFMNPLELPVLYFLFMLSVLEFSFLIMQTGAQQVSLFMAIKWTEQSKNLHSRLEKVITITLVYHYGQGRGIKLIPKSSLTFSFSCKLQHHSLIKQRNEEENRKHPHTWQMNILCQEKLWLPWFVRRGRRSVSLVALKDTNNETIRDRFCMGCVLIQ